MGGLHELQAPVLVVGDVAPSQLELEGQAVVRGAEQHRLPAQREPLLPVGQDACDHKLGLFVLIAAGDQARPLSPGALGPQILLVAFRGLCDDAIGHFEDGGGAAEVLIEGNHRGIWELQREVEDVTHGGAAESVDGLGVVAHYRQPVTPGAEQGENLGLERVRVLILVH